MAGKWYLSNNCVTFICKFIFKVCDNCAKTFRGRVQNERAAESNFGLAVRKGNRISHG